MNRPPVRTLTGRPMRKRCSDTLSPARVHRFGRRKSWPRSIRTRNLIRWRASSVPRSVRPGSGQGRVLHGRWRPARSKPVHGPCRHDRERSPSCKHAPKHRVRWPARPMSARWYEVRRLPTATNDCRPLCPGVQPPTLGPGVALRKPRSDRASGKSGSGTWPRSQASAGGSPAVVKDVPPT